MKYLSKCYETLKSCHEIYHDNFNYHGIFHGMTLTFHGILTDISLLKLLEVNFPVHSTVCSIHTDDVYKASY